MSQHGPVSTIAGGGGAGGKVIQVLETSTSAFLTLTTVMPYDNSIPQQTEGTQVLTLTITPTVDTNKLFITFVACVSDPVANVVCTAALFQDATANALASTNIIQGTGMGGTELNYSMIAGTASSTTFKIRVGPASSTMYINGSGTARYGGVASTTFKIVEIEI